MGRLRLRKSVFSYPSDFILCPFNLNIYISLSSNYKRYDCRESNRNISLRIVRKKRWRVDFGIVVSSRCYWRAFVAIKWIFLARIRALRLAIFYARASFRLKAVVIDHLTGSIVRERDKERTIGGEREKEREKIMRTIDLFNAGSLNRRDWLDSSLRNRPIESDRRTSGVLLWKSSTDLSDRKSRIMRACIKRYIILLPDYYPRDGDWSSPRKRNRLPFFSSSSSTRNFQAV